MRLVDFLRPKKKRTKVNRVPEKIAQYIPLQRKAIFFSYRTLADTAAP